MLKPLDHLLVPDASHEDLALFGAGVAIARPHSLDALHSSVGTIDLRVDVPERVRRQFDVARNLLVYSWFVFEFASASELYAYSSVELALREKGAGGSSKTPSFKSMLQQALDEGWLQDYGFRRGRERLEQWEAQSEHREDLAEIGVKFESFDTDPQFYSRIIADTLPTFRNHLAHGNPARDRTALGTLELCAELIAQLFSSSSRPPSASA